MTLGQQHLAQLWDAYTARIQEWEKTTDPEIAHALWCAYDEIPVERRGVVSLSSVRALTALMHQYCVPFYRTPKG